MSFNHLSDAEIKEALALRERLDLLKKQEICKTNFLEFIDHMWDGFICGRHHKIFAEKLEGIANGTIKRLIVHIFQLGLWEEIQAEKLCKPPTQENSLLGSVGKLET